MRTIGNIIWILLGGIWIAAAWTLAGLILYITIIGIPLGSQCMKMSALTLAPFGKEVVYGGGTMSFVANLLWILLAGVWLAAGYIVAGLANMITIIGIPFALQSFKMAKLALMPFGAEIV